MTNAIESEAEFRRARSRLIAHRISLFAVAWIGLNVIWRVLMIFDGRLAPLPAAWTLLAQAVVLGLATWLCRRAPEAPRVPWVALGTCLLLTPFPALGVVAVDGSAEALASALFLLHVAAAVLFAWGWRFSLGLLAGMLLTWALALPSLRFVILPAEFALGVAGGALAGLVAAELFAREFRRTWGHREAAREAIRQLEVSRNAYRDLAENARDLIYTHDLAGRFTYVNAAFAEYVGAPAETLIGQVAPEMVDRSRLNPDLWDLIRRLAAGESVQPQVIAVTTPSGPRWVECVVSAMRDASGAVIGVQGIGRDVTEAKRLEEALRESQERYRGLIETQVDLFLRFDREGRITYVNDAFCELSGQRCEDILGTSGEALIHPEDWPAIQDSLWRLGVPPYRGRVDARVLGRDETRWVAWEGCGIRSAGDVMVGYQVVGRDVTERRVMEDTLRASLEDRVRSEEALRRLAAHQAMIREDERKRLGFDLHDGVCQELVGIGILVESLRGAVPTEAAARIDQVVGYLKELGDHVRVLARELRPPLLRDLGLEDSLRSLAGGMSSGTTRVICVFSGTIPRLDEEVEIGVYRIAQEALTNALRHAETDRVELVLACDGHALRLEVKDAGRGFELSEEQRTGTVGLMSINERALALGGHLEVRSAPGQGTVVRFECPLNAGGSTEKRAAAMRSQ